MCPSHTIGSAHSRAMCSAAIQHPPIHQRPAPDRAGARDWPVSPKCLIIAGGSSEQRLLLSHKKDAIGSHGRPRRHRFLLPVSALGPAVGAAVLGACERSVRGRAPTKHSLHSPTSRAAIATLWMLTGATSSAWIARPRLQTVVQGEPSPNLNSDDAPVHAITSAP